jgi:4-amino-4-deoxy-L-arabinose transferase-like glycosyltransferase
MRAGDAFPEFLVLWALFPIVFFSFSGSKLPGYILPALPPLGILAGDYLNRIRKSGLPRWLLWTHALECGMVVLVVVLAPQHMEYGTLVPPRQWIFIGLAWAVVTVAGVWAIIRKGGVRAFCAATMLPVIGGMVFLLGRHGHDLDLNYSARPLAKAIVKAAPDVKTIAVEDIKRDMDYGLVFYFDQPMQHYDKQGLQPDEENLQTGVPAGEHILVVRAKDVPRLDQWLAGRVYVPLFLYEWQGLAVYKVYARQ